MERLLEVEEFAFKQTNEQINLLEKYLADYKILQNKLRTLPDELQYDIMVPFGTVGFMPGRMVHTNEVKILLGDDWFLETSANHAVNIIERRNAKLEDQIAALRKQNKLIEPRIDFTSQLTQSYSKDKDIVEIKEDYDEEAETVWKEKHKKNVKKYYESMAQRRRKPAEALSQDFWSKYDDNENDQQNDDSKDIKLRHRVSFGSNIMTKEDNYNIDDNNGDLKAKTIFFKHSNHTPIINPIITAELNSPADLYKNHKSMPKSILKKQSSNEHLDTSINKEECKKELPEEHVDACLSVVLERNSLPHANCISNILHHEPKKVSKFKASRLKTTI